MRRHAKALVAIFASLLSMLAIAGPAAAAPPTITIGAPSSVSYTSAHVSGTVNPNGWGGEVWVYFEFTEVGNPSWQQKSAGVFPGAEGTSPIPVETDLTGLKPGVEYEVRIQSYTDGFTPSPEPNPVFTTTSLSAPAVSIDAPASVTGTTAQFSGTIDPEAPVGNPAAADVSWRFECTPACPGLSGTIAADSSPHPVSGEATGLDPNTDYEVTLVAENAAGPVTAGPEAFKTLRTAPIVQATYPNLNFAGATLRGRVNPRNSAVTYQFEWGTTTAYGNVTPASPTPLGSQANTLHHVESAISGLTPGATYHYRLVATNTDITAVAHSADRIFTAPSTAPSPAPCANDIFRVGLGALLPDCRAYEQVTPVNKQGIEPASSEGKIQENFLAGLGGGLAQYVAPGDLGGSQAAEQLTHYQSTRGPAGWSTRGIEPPQGMVADIAKLTVTMTAKDLAHSVVVSRLALAPGATDDMYNTYVQDNRTLEREFIYSSSIRPYWYDFSGTKFIGATPDFSHVIFRERQALTPDAPDNGEPKLYHYHDGQVRLANYGPDDQPSTKVQPMSSNADLSETISADGSVIVYPLGEHTGWSTGLYKRENGHTEAISVSQRAGEVGRVVGGIVEWVSPDGSIIDFISYEPLLDNAAWGDGEITQGWLYRYEDGQLIELVDSASGANVEETEVRADGEYVYSVAGDKILAWHDGETTVAVDGLFGTSLGVSENGRYAAFSSLGAPTGYDSLNVAACEGLCRQVYVYDYAAKELACASCRNDGGAPTGPSGFGASPPNARVTNEGAVYFNTPDPLVDTDVNGQLDTYQFRDGVQSLISTGVSERGSRFGGVSADGQDVFFYSGERLVGQDFDRLRDVYDARVGGGLAGQWPADPPAQCEGEACKGPTSSPPGTNTPGTESFHGPGKSNPRVVPSRCQSLSTKARGATKKAKAKPKGKQRGKAMKQAKKLTKKASKCRAGAAR